MIIIELLLFNSTLLLLGMIHNANDCFISSIKSFQIWSALLFVVHHIVMPQHPIFHDIQVYILHNKRSVGVPLIHGLSTRGVNKIYE
jgi:hypothetical protein